MVAVHADGSAWAELCATLEGARAALRDPSFPDTPADRAEYLRYLLRFFASGIATCVEHADPDHPEFTRMMDLNRRWGLDSPDHLYLFAPIRGDAEYRVSGESGPDHRKTFTVEVRVGDDVLGAASGKAKKEAEQEAARLALERLSTPDARPGSGP